MRPESAPSLAPGTASSLPIEQFFERSRPGLGEILFLDYDGTLAAFTEDRDRAFPREGVREELAKLIAQTQTRVILVSGRPAPDVARLLGLSGLEIWGGHGTERMFPDGRLERVVLSDAVKQGLAEARESLADLGEPERVEVKPTSIAFHFRGLPVARVHELTDWIQSHWKSILCRTDELESHQFDGGLELRLAGVDKGDAILGVLVDCAPDAPVAYLGDDLTDEDAFAALQPRGLCLLVRDEARPTRADAWLRPDRELLQFLSRWRQSFSTPRHADTMKTTTLESEVIIVSNRLPIVLNHEEDGSFSIERGTGGLVQAMNPILERSGGRWIGWPGVVEEDLGDGPLRLDRLELPFELHPVVLSADEVDLYYRGFANSIVWPLFHNFPDRCSFEPDFWDAYLKVNEKFAETIAAVVESGHPLWVHDYHLIHLAQMLRERMEPGRIGFFLHIPFPSLDNFVKLPWRADLLRALLSYDLLGFQSSRDRRHFLECVQRLMPEVEVDGNDEGLARIRTADRTICVGVFPIGLDFDSWEKRAQSPEVEQRVRLLRREIGPYQILLGIDRLDYTKGLLERFRAFERALEQHPQLVEKAMLFQVVVPSRESVPEYAALKREIDRVVGRINGRFSTPSWQPIHYLYNTVDPVELTALYRLADVAVVTPLCDGMNLVCKEYAASQVEERGVLILGEMAGAASQVSDAAILVNPYDIDGTAHAIAAAVAMPDTQRRKKMKQLREVVSSANVFRWADNFMRALDEPSSLGQTSQPEYLPHIDAPQRG